MTHLLMLLFDVFVLGGICFVGAVVFLWRYRAQRSGRRPSLARHLLRSPGESLRARMEDAQWRIASLLAAGMLPLPAVLGIYFTSWVIGSSAPSGDFSTLLAALGLVAQCWLGWRLWKVLARLRSLMLDHEAQLAVGQELAELGRSGYRIFHDFPMGNGEQNIDHVLVGPGGVFCVDTEGRATPARKAGTDEPWELTYDGRTLEFLGWTETEPLLQAQRNADWLQTWLSGAVGKAIAVQPVLALPGWFVRRAGEDGIPVLAGGEIQGWFASRPKSALMSPELIQQVVRQLDQKCRDASPRAHEGSPAGVRELKASRAP